MGGNGRWFRVVAAGSGRRPHPSPPPVGEGTFGGVLPVQGGAPGFRADAPHPNPPPVGEGMFGGALPVQGGRPHPSPPPVGEGMFGGVLSRRGGCYWFR